MGFLRRPQNLKKIFVVLLTRASCSVCATAYLSKSRWRFFKTNVVNLYYTIFNILIQNWSQISKGKAYRRHKKIMLECIKNVWPSSNKLALTQTTSRLLWIVKLPDVSRWDCIRTTNVWWGNRLHCMAKNQIPIPNF